MPSRSRGFRPLLRFIPATAAVLAILAGSPLRAQDAPPTPAPAPADTVVQEPPPLDLERSPRGAFLRSLAIPGWGQAWVGSPVRGGVYFAIEAGSVWMAYKSRQKLREARVEEAWLRRSGQLQPNELFGLAREREDQVEDWTTLAIFFLFFSAADAWVSAHLADFDEHIGVLPGPDGGLRLQARIPVGGRR
jgi:hypothetical protein